MRKIEAGNRQELTGQTLVNKTKWHRQTENTDINTQRISGEDGRLLEGVETSTRTGETDQGVTRTIFQPSLCLHPVQQAINQTPLPGPIA
jgi:hypothetical protein